MTVVATICEGIVAFAFTQSFGSINESALSIYTTSIVLSAGLIIISAIGKANGQKVPIMAFVFGILTICISAGLIGDMGWRASSNVSSIIVDASNTSIVPYAIALLCRCVQLAMAIIVIVLSILNILRGMQIIKLTQSYTKAPVKASRESPQGTKTGAAERGTTIAAPEGSQAQESKFCSECGQPLTEGAKFCRNCGAAA